MELEDGIPKEHCIYLVGLCRKMSTWIEKEYQVCCDVLRWSGASSVFHLP